MKSLRILVFTCLILPLTASANLNSFNEVRDFVYEEALEPGEPLPTYVGVVKRDLLDLIISKFQSLFGKRPDLSKDWDFAVRSRKILTNSSNFKEPAVKWLHPRGACASAEWIIDSDSPATGLFSRGTNVPAIIRVSSGNHDSKLINDDGVPARRLFGMAVKLFHSKDLDKPAKTTNILTLDTFGFSRSTRPYILQKEKEELFFTNVSPARGVFAKILSKGLDLFDDPNHARPMNNSASLDADGEVVENPTTPFQIHFIPRFEKPRAPFGDFRYELLKTKIEDGHFDIVIKQMKKGGEEMNIKIGKLHLMEPFAVSENCDLSLAFHHRPNQEKEEYLDSKN